VVRRPLPLDHLIPIAKGIGAVLSTDHAHLFF